MPVKCSECLIDKPKSQFGKAQLQKDPNKRRCRVCTSSSSSSSPQQVIKKSKQRDVQYEENKSFADELNKSSDGVHINDVVKVVKGVRGDDDVNKMLNYEEGIKPQPPQQEQQDNVVGLVTETQAKNEDINKSVNVVEDIKEDIPEKELPKLTTIVEVSNNNNDEPELENIANEANSNGIELSGLSEPESSEPERASEHTSETDQGNDTNDATVNNAASAIFSSLFKIPRAGPVRRTQSTVSELSATSPMSSPLIDHIDVDNDIAKSGRIRVGICAMDKKAKSKPMGEILSRLDKALFEIVPFGDDIILNSPVTEWPICDVLIAFYSSGYPLDKAEEYVELHPDIFILNDLKMQRVLMDRRRVYDLLLASGIDVPRHVFMNRDGYVSTNDLISSSVSSNFPSDAASIISNQLPSIRNLDVDGDGDNESELIEHDDHIEINGVVIHKPFVEKPVDADDHNIAIYYPYSAGGGCKKLFRKIGDRSSEFYPHINEVRRDGSYIYEEYVETQGIDVKMYTVGPDYGHAEARKSPTVDGKVERNADGKEVRFPVILTLREKEIARRIVMVFKQHVCGFDLLRVQEGDSLVSYVCDVNGWSFVKKSKKYYDDCAQILTEHMLASRKPSLLHGFSTLNPLLTKVKDFVADTPKRRKMEKTISPEKTNLDGTKENQAYMLAEGASHVRDIPDMLFDDTAQSIVLSDKGDDETVTSKSTAKSSNIKQSTVTHQEELRCVITVIRHGDRTPKQKLKVKMSEPAILQYFHDHIDNPKKELKVKDKIPMTEFLETVKSMIAVKQLEPEYDENRIRKDDIVYKLLHMRDVLERWKIGGLNRKLQMKPTKWDEFITPDGVKILKCSEVQLILKWGGNLTKLGEKQSINLGQRLRHTLYPDEAGGGILRLHSTFRHDLKIKTSDEGRVMKTAAAFAKGLLELEGEITPILVSLVHKEKNSQHMLDPSGNKEVKKELEACKVEINEALQQDFYVASATRNMVENCVGPTKLTSLHKALKKVGNPRKTLFAIRDAIGELLEQLDEMLGGLTSDMENQNEDGEGLLSEEDQDEALSGIKLYKGETLLELTERWRLLYTKLYDDEDDEFDLSRVPDVHDNVRFDMLHNPHLGLTSTLKKLYKLAKLMADCVVPQEYGKTIEQKRNIGKKMCGPLMDKLLYDLIIARTDNQVDMRYMINMHYSADLPINSMGRRIRTRLYFTSESHLHTLCNVLRFASTDTTSKVTNPLSPRGIHIISNASELCYLTQIAIRLFENPAKDVDDPRRFRIEIFFSPGATATPMHVSELERDAESSRFDTEPLQLISKPYLTCKELEDYFTQAIKEGKMDESHDNDDNHTSSVFLDENMEPLQVNNTMNVEPPIPPKIEVDTVPISDNEELNTSVSTTERVKCVTISEEKNNYISFAEDNVNSSGHSTLGEEHPLEQSYDTVANDDKASINSTDKTVKETENSQNENVSNIIENSPEQKTLIVDTAQEDGKKEEEDKVKDDGSIDEDERVKKMAVVLARQYFWTSVAAVSFVLGIGCLILSKEVKSDIKTRRWSRR